jgi:hypothetical protein
MVLPPKRNGGGREMAKALRLRLTIAVTAG